MVNEEVLYVEDYQYLLRGARGKHIRDICPFCNERRSNKKDKCLSIEVATLAYYCHYCNAKGYMRSRMNDTLSKDQRIFKPKKMAYVKPQPKDKSREGKFGESFLAYFKGRGISEKTLVEAKITQEVEYIPQEGKKCGCIAFNYYVGDELINIKHRSRNKNFKLVSGAKLVPYNINSIAPEAYEEGEEKSCIYVEGECFDDKASILTESGWKLFKDLKVGEKVAQYDKGEISFVEPLKYIRKEYNGELVRYKNKRNSYYSMTTPNHNLLCVRDGVERKVKACDITSTIGVVRSGVINNEGLDISDDELRLFCAISADFTIRESGDLYAAFKKERKVKRIREILDSLGIKYSDNIDARQYHSIFIRRGHGILCSKDFPMDWIGKLSYRQMNLILDEVIYWDGNLVKGRTMKEYNSNRYNNIVFIQTLCHLTNKRSTICKRHNELGEWYKCTIIQNPSTFVRPSEREDVNYNGFVYCVKVPSGCIVVRQNDLINITGNCDVLAYIEAGFHHVVSVPNGASTNLEYLDDFIDSHFDKLDTIYVSVDNDKKGLECRAELLRRFGDEKCKIVDYPKPCKDINEVLMQYGKEAVSKCVETAKEAAPEGLKSLEDVEDEVDYIFEHGFEKGATIGVRSIDNILSFKTGLLHIVTGVPSHGKSFMLNDLVIRLNIIHGWKAAFFSPEFYPVSHHIAQTLESLGGKRFSSDNYNRSTYEEMKDYLCKNFFFIDPNDTDINSVMERARYLIKKRGIKVLVIDPFNALTDKERKSQKQDEYISEFLQKIRWFGRKYDVAIFLVMHPVKLIKLENGLYPVCDLYACKGASEINDKADVGLTVWRNKDEDYAELHVTKMKFRNLGKLGHATLKFNINNGRYVEIEEVEDLKSRGVDIKSMPIEWDNSNWVLNKINSSANQTNLVFPEPTPQPNEEMTDQEYLSQDMPFGFGFGGEAPF